MHPNFLRCCSVSPRLKICERLQLVPCLLVYCCFQFAPPPISPSFTRASLARGRARGSSIDPLPHSPVQFTSPPTLRLGVGWLPMVVCPGPDAHCSYSQAPGSGAACRLVISRLCQPLVGGRASDPYSLAGCLSWYHQRKWATPWLVPYLGGGFCPIFEQEKMSFQRRPLEHCLMETVKISSTYVYVFKYSIGFFVCCLNYNEIFID